MTLNPLRLKQVDFAPPLFCAPMAGITHSAFRRLMADFGGYGALFTELQAGNKVLREDAATSTYLKRRPCEGKVIYQLMVMGDDNTQAILDKILPLEPAGIDINCGCAAHNVRGAGGGTALFDDIGQFERVLRSFRAHYAGPLTVKARLGRRDPDWQEQFCRRLRLMEDCGVDAITVHPRFADQHRRRGADHKLFPWMAENTRLPIIANGDILGPETVAAHPEHFARVAGIMIGRMAAIRPWIFAAWNQPDYPVNHLEIWTRFYDYLLEDFHPQKALVPLKIFTTYFARNFVFGHTLFAATRPAPDIQSLRERALQFLSNNPQIDPTPSITGI